MQYVFLSIFGVFLSVSLTLACNSDRQCSLRCCDHTDGRGNLNEGVCISRATCDGFCTLKEDCLAPKLCDTYRNLCTTKCSFDIDCHPSYVCENYQCVEDDGFVGTTPILIIGLAVLISFICCCFRLKRGQRQRDQVRRNYNTDTNTTHVNTTEGNEQPTGNVGTLEMNSPNEGSNDEVLDAVALSGPPSYIEVSNVPDVPPPSYEEAVKISTENLSQGREGQPV